VYSLPAQRKHINVGDKQEDTVRPAGWVVGNPIRKEGNFAQNLAMRDVPADDGKVGT
jgi:hypothetical protein